MIRSLARFFRLRLSLLNGVVAAGGCLLFHSGIETIPLCAAFFGVACLAAGGSSLNQVMERDIDALMLRTSSRPLPKGQLTPCSATAIGATVILAGLTLLTAVGGVQPALIGFSVLTWYLAVYTPLKRRTPFALAIGAVCGAFPPVIGWCLAGGNPTDYRIMLMAGLLYLWQIPHFWLFQSRHADDYRLAGIPLLAMPDRSNGLFRVWLFALVAAAMLVPAFGIISRHVAVWYFLFPVPLIAFTLLRSETALFSYLNLFPLLLTLTLTIQR